MNDDISQIILDELRAHRVESAKRHEDLDKRVRNTEKWIANANGKVTMLGVFGAAIGSGLTWLSGVFKAH